MLELDQILKANELTMSLVAAIPAIALMWGTLAALARCPAPPLGVCSLIPQPTRFPPPPTS